MAKTKTTLFELSGVRVNSAGFLFSAAAYFSYRSNGLRTSTPGWVVAQAESLVTQARSQGLPVTMVQRDRDTKFSKAFDRILKRRQVKVMPVAYRSPNTNAFVERFIQSIQQECLDRFVVFGERHLDHLCQQYLAHFHQE